MLQPLKIITYRITIRLLSHIRQDLSRPKKYEFYKAGNVDRTHITGLQRQRNTIIRYQPLVEIRGIEPLTSALQKQHSPAELYPHSGDGGIETS